MTESATLVSKCIIVDPASGPLAVEVMEVDTKGALLKTEVAFQQNEYIDASLELNSGHRLSLFAHVIDSGAGGLRLRWLHFDPSEEQKLVDFLAGKGLDDISLPPPSGESPADAVSERERERQGTRRIVKPSSESRPIEISAVDQEPRRRTRKVVRPRTKGSDEAVVDFTPMGGHAATEEGSRRGEAVEGGRRTRKIVRPRKHDTVRPFEEGGDEYAPSDGDQPADPGNDPGSSTDQHIARAAGEAEGGGSGAHDVVLASTQKYEELKAGSKVHRRTKRHNIVDDSGKLDVGATIRSKAKTVAASELAARHERVRVLNMKTIKALIQDAVAEAVQHLGSHLDEEEKERLLKEAEDEFQERLKAFKAENQGLQAQADNLHEQLERAQELLEEERHRKIEADQFTVSDAGLVDMEKRFERIIQRTVRDNRVSDEVAGDLRGVINKLLDEERQHIADQARKAQGEAIALLEKKVSRLARTLDDTQAERDKAHRAMKAIQASGGSMRLQNVMEAGLDEEDPAKEQKLELLKDIFNQNKALRDELQSKGVEIKSRRRRPPAVEAVEAGDVERQDPPDEVAALEAQVDDEVADLAEEPAVDEEGLPAVDGQEMDPDDMPWEIGMSARTDVAGEDDDEDVPVRRINASDALAGFKVPPLQRQEAGDDAQADVEAEDSVDDEQEMDPDDMPWEVGMSARAEGEGDNEDEDEEGGGPVKRISASDAIAGFEPPPLKRDG